MGAYDDERTEDDAWAELSALYEEAVFHGVRLEADLAAALARAERAEEQRDRARAAALDAGELLAAIAGDWGEWAEAVAAQQDDIRAALADEPLEVER